MITSPTQFSGLQVWLDASDTTTLFQLSGGTTAVAANLDPVGYWGDKSGNNRHFTNTGGTSATRPTWVSSLSTVRFDGSNDYLSSFFNITYTAQTVFVVASQRTYNAQARLYTQVSSGGSDSTATGHFIPFYFNSPSTIASYNNGSNRSTITIRGLSAFDVYTSWMSSTSGVNFLNGSNGGYYGATINYAVALSRLGATATALSNYFNGDISEVIVYNRALADLERADVEYYLTRKWNFLNSIPRQVYGIKNSLWSLTDTWSVSAEPSPWNFPLSADNAYTNTFTITADSSTRVDTIRNTVLSPNISAGGSFVLANGVSLSCVSPLPLVTYPATLLTLVPAATASFYGTINGNIATSPAPVIVPSSSTFTLYGSAYNGTANTLSGNIVNFGTTNIFGDVLSPNGVQGGNTNSSVVLNCNQLNIVGRVNSNACGNDGSRGHISNIGTTTVNITGNVVLQYASFRCFCLFNPTNVNIIGNVTALGSQSQTGAIQGAGVVNVRGNVSGPVFRSVTTANLTGSVIGDIYGNMESVTNFNMVNGNIFASTIATPVVTTNATLSNVNLYANNVGHAISCTTSLTGINCNVINAPNGRQAIYAPRVLMLPGASATYTRHAVNGYDSFVDYWTSNATFNYPASSDVVFRTTYNNNALTGTMVLPSPSSVALGAPVGTTIGTASITLDSVLSQPIANLTTPNSIGARLKNITTSQALSSVINSLTPAN